jgi:hypothetical protein
MKVIPVVKKYTITSSPNPSANAEPEVSTLPVIVFEIPPTKAESLPVEIPVPEVARGERVEVILCKIELDVTINTFIPHNNVDHPNNWVFGDDTVFAGDNRISGSPARATWNENGSHRTQQKLKLVSIQSIDPNGLVDDSFDSDGNGTLDSDRYVHIGESHEFEKTSSLDPSGNLTATAWADTALGDSHLMVGKGTASSSSVWIESTTWLGPRKLEVKCRCDSPNPLVSYAPGIGYTLKITVDYTDMTATKYSLEGSHDGFPAFEVYLNRVRVHHYDPLVTGEGPISLGPPEEKSVSQIGNPIP